VQGFFFARYLKTVEFEERREQVDNMVEIYLAFHNSYV